MADLEEQFQKAAENVKKLKKSPTDMELLELYGSFKQATVGDINPNESAPAFYKMKELAKHKAWKAQTGKSCSTLKTNTSKLNTY